MRRQREPIRCRDGELLEPKIGKRLGVVGYDPEFLSPIPAVDLMVCSKEIDGRAVCSKGDRMSGQSPLHANFGFQSGARFNAALGKLHPDKLIGSNAEEPR